MTDIMPIFRDELDKGKLNKLNYEDQVRTILHSKINKDLKNLGISAEMFINCGWDLLVEVRFKTLYDLNYYKIAGNLRESRIENDNTVKWRILCDSPKQIFLARVVFTIMENKI